ncbi:MAG: MFS transporter, partial [Bdellovibrionales bacterium]|nr:MFS transporter [Bdellovibrionales bacterium]
MFQRRDLLFFSFLQGLGFLDRYIVAAVLPLLIADMKLSNTEAGYLVSAFVLGYLVFSPFFGILGDRVARPPLMALGVFLWSLATLASGLTSDFSLFLLARIGVGIGEASFGTLAPGYIRDKLRDPIKTNSALSIFFSAIPVGSALGYATGGIIAERFGWNTTFLLAAVPGLLLSPLLLRYREEPREHLTQDGLGASLVKIVTLPVLMLALLGYVLSNFTLTGVSAFVTQFGTSIGFTLESVALWFGVILLCAGFLGSYFGGQLASRLASKADDAAHALLRFSAIVTLCSGPFFFAAFAASDPL